MSERITIPLSTGSASVLRAPADGPALVLVHGAGGNAQTWASTLPAWSGFDLWCPSLPGRDGSSGPAATSAGEAANWLAEVLTVAGVDRPIVLGHSFGGAVALELAFAEDIEIEALVLVASGARLRVSPVILEAAAQASPEVAFPIRFAFGQGTPDAIIDAYAVSTARTPPAATLADWHACNGFDRLTQLDQLDARVLVVHGDRDTLTPAKYQRKLEDAIAGAVRVEIPSAGHMLPWEQPEALAAAVREQLGRG